MKLASLVNPKFHAALDKLAAQPLPLKTAFRLKGAVKIIREQVATYEDVRKTALDKLSKKNEDGSIAVDDKNNVQFEEADLKEFMTQIDSLMSLEVEFPTIAIADLGNDISILLEDIMTLDGFIVE